MSSIISEQPLRLARPHHRFFGVPELRRAPRLLRPQDAEVGVFGAEHEQSSGHRSLRAGTYALFQP